MFEELTGQNVKANFYDCDGKSRLAKGRLVEVKDGFVKIQGEIGIIILSQNAITQVTVKRGDKV